MLLATSHSMEVSIATLFLKVCTQPIAGLGLLLVGLTILLALARGSGLVRVTISNFAADFVRAIKAILLAIEFLLSLLVVLLGILLWPAAILIGILFGGTQVLTRYARQRRA